jgi:hypothetical protein
MTFSVAHSSRKPLGEENQRVARVALALFTIAAIGYLAFLLKFNCYFAAGPDSAGYLTEAKMIASGHMSVDVTILRELKLPPPMTYVVTPLGWARAQVDGFMVPTYPAGLPFHQALLGILFGWSRAPFLVAPLLAFLSLFVLIGLMRELDLPMICACTGAAILATIPTLVNHAVQPVSDVVATFYSILALWLALRSRSSVEPAILPALPSATSPGDAGRIAGDTQGGAIRSADVYAALAGIAFAIGVWVRPTNFLLVLPLAFALRWNIRRLVVSAIAALPFGIALGWWNQTLYGSALRTGYGTLWDVIKPHPVCGAFHLKMLGWMLTPVVVVGALFVFFDRRIAGWLRLLLGVWFGSFLLFYSFYGSCDERFLLPALPALIIGFMAVLRRRVDLLRGRRPKLVPLAAALILVAVLSRQFFMIHHLRAVWPAYDDAIYPTSVAFAEARLPKDAVLLTGLMGGAFLYDTNRFTIHFSEVPIDGRLPVLRAAVKRTHRHWYALLSTVETNPHEWEVWSPSRWEPVGMNRDVTLWRLEE